MRWFVRRNAPASIAVRVRGAGLDLQALHDELWVNGNVPIALLRWELLGLTDELPALGLDPK